MSRQSNIAKTDLQIQTKEILVLGGGMSGVAAAAFLQFKGARVTLADNKERSSVSEAVLALENQGVRLHLGGMPTEVDKFDLAVISPGIPLSVPVAVALKTAGVKIIGELELAYLFSHNPYLAITGTNGKTTTTSLVGYILQVAGIECIVGGNIGKALVNSVEGLSDEAYIVAEVSSFQLETTQNFRARVGAFLNLTPDHLNRHQTMKNYGDIKAKVFANQGPDDFAILNHDDQLVADYASNIKGRVVFFSRHQQLEEGFYVEEGKIVTCQNGKPETIINVDEIFIKGGHNLENVLAAVALTYSVGVGKEVIAKALREFKGVEHRQEFVADKNGVVYINDSKGTNPDSTIQALLAYNRPMVLILGGRNKGGDFTPLMPLIKERVKKVVLVGEAADEIKAVLDKFGYTAYEEAGYDFAKCVELAAAAAESGDVVMLSPACASWDMFKCFEERGDLFKKLVAQIKFDSENIK